jgi:tetratricopeptide (TPR) repeat protein
LNLGVYAQQHGDMQQAVARYDAALERAGDARIRASAYAYLGQIYFAQHDYTHARSDYEAAARLGNAFPLPLGLLAQKTGDWNSAAVYYAQLLSAQPSDVGFLLLEDALRGAGREQDAQRAHQKAELLSSDLAKAQQTADDLLRQ